MTYPRELIDPIILKNREFDLEGFVFGMERSNSLAPILIMFSLSKHMMFFRHSILPLFSTIVK